MIFKRFVFLSHKQMADLEQLLRGALNGDDEMPQQGFQALGMPGQMPGQMLGQHPGQMPGQYPGQMPSHGYGIPGQYPGQMPGQMPGQGLPYNPTPGLTHLQGHAGQAGKITALVLVDGATALAGMVLGTEKGQRVIDLLLGKSGGHGLSGSMDYEAFRKPYWILSALESLISGQKSVDQFFDTLQHGTEVSVSLENPWPFLALHYLHLPIWILRRALNLNFDWTYDEFVASQL